MDGWMDWWESMAKTVHLVGLVVLLLGAELYDLNFGALIPYCTCDNTSQANSPVRHPKTKTSFKKQQAQNTQRL
ncbi:hypothetical protein VTJ04DRAFT_2233 [Mycothermus thermophilus]|uniref:uncharacterized protein n=1 Tax=Humicola insolens TaxID=85995 RepID=UPI00374285CE